MRLTGLLLGAGASVEVGMPLASKLTDELKEWLTPDKLRWLNSVWLERGNGYSDETIDDLAQLLVIDGLTYENITGYLEVQRNRPTGRSDEYHGLVAFLSEIIYFLLREKHVLNAARIEHNIKYLDGIKAFTENNKPLWVFSLNHDLVVECYSASTTTPLKCGFSEESILLPWRDSNGNRVGDTKANIIRREHFTEGTLRFFQNGEEGINLLKIHGSLDEFAFNDGQDLLKIVPTCNTVLGVIAELKGVNDEVQYIDPEWPGGVVKTVNEIAYEDSSGEMQFLRRTPLIGPFKFQDQSTQTTPLELLNVFRTGLNFLSRLITIGYSFGDLHVTQELRSWLEGDGARHLTIVDPGLERIPTALLHLSPQIELIQSQATDFLDCEAGIIRNRLEIIVRQLSAWQRDKPDGELVSLMRQHQDLMIRVVADNILNYAKTLPFRDGDVDLEELGLSEKQFSEILLSKANIPSVEESLEEFLRQTTGDELS